MVDLAAGGNKDSRCAQCNGLLALVDDLSAGLACPGCGDPMQHAQLGTWT